jgi:hypothetical protein
MAGPGSKQEVVMKSGRTLDGWWSRRAVVLASAFGVALASGACGGGTTPVGPTSLSTAAQQQAEPATASSGVTASARPTIQAGGQGAWMEGPYAPSNQRTFSFDAQAGPGDRQTGQIEVFGRGGLGIRNNIRLDCVRYDPDTRILLMGGTVTNSNSPAAPVGMRVVTAVRDNGQGAGAEPDEVAFVLPAGAVGECQYLPFPADYVQPYLVTITSGDIHIHASN